MFPPPPTAPSAGPQSAPPQHALAIETGVIALGGAVGAILRYAAEVYIAIPSFGQAWAGALVTLSVNLMGAFLLGVLFGHIDAGRGHPLLRPFLGVGVLGSFTTFSGFVADLSIIRPDAGLGATLAFVLATLILGLAAFELGRRVMGAPVRSATR